MQTVYTAHATAIGGRNGHVETDDAQLALNLAGLDNKEKQGTNPEQLFACAYSACFGSALAAVAGKQNIDASKAEVTAHVSLLKEGTGFKLAAELEVKIPGLYADTVRSLTEKAHEVCPYSKATRGNIEVTLKTA